MQVDTRERCLDEDEQLIRRLLDLLKLIAHVRVVVELLVNLRASQYQLQKREAKEMPCFSPPRSFISEILEKREKV